MINNKNYDWPIHFICWTCGKEMNPTSEKNCSFCHNDYLNQRLYNNCLICNCPLKKSNYSLCKDCYYKVIANDYYFYNKYCSKNGK